LEVLDPACGDGALLLAVARCVPPQLRKRLVLVGYETDSAALAQASTRLSDSGAREIVLRQQDFLEIEGLGATLARSQLDFFECTSAEPPKKYDVVIANPPYVRTQVLGARAAQKLARRFRLSGRVDLYHAFTKAMAEVLKPEGVLGLLTSNRFLFIRSGVSLRRLLRSEFDLDAIYDLGDTKLFSAAVLPVIVVARKRRARPLGNCAFHRVYECRRASQEPPTEHRYASVLHALRDASLPGLVGINGGIFTIERGVLAVGDSDEVWSLSTPAYQDWLATIRAHTAHSFTDVGHIRVGIKTTADAVFLRDDWDTLPAETRPEKELLHPVVTHFEAGRWLAAAGRRRKYVLYPHVVRSEKCVPVDLKKYPRAAAYLGLHKKRLEGRKYVIEGGRNWYEIWVPQNPGHWSRPRVVFPDIAEHPRFFFDSSGAVVNGDCYWITTRPGRGTDWLMLMLAVANSTLITKYYDVMFHNKLYSGRRRFMVQYVRQFPLPDLKSESAQEIVELTSRMVQEERVDQEAEKAINKLVWRCFGLVEETSR
jgi:SAM-dependent methyltransferase